jgi:hypothetical protein
MLVQSRKRAERFAVSAYCQRFTACTSAGPQKLGGGLTGTT